MNNEQKYLEHLEAFDEDTVENWEDYFLAFSKTMYPIAARHGMSFGEAMLMFKINQVYNALVSREENEDNYK